MSFALDVCSICTRHIGMGFSGVPNRRMNLARKLSVCNSNFNSSKEMSVGMPFKTTLRGRSEGSEKVWKSA